MNVPKSGYSLLNFFILEKSKLQNDEEFLYYHPPDLDRDEKLRKIGLSVGLIRFLEGFGSQIKSIINNNNDYYFHETKDLFICAILKKVKGDGTENKGEEEQNKNKRASYIKLETKNYLPKNDFINRELENSFEMYSLFYPEIERKSIEEFYNLYLKKFFLAPDNLLLVNYLSCMLTKKFSKKLEFFNFVRIIEKNFNNPLIKEYFVVYNKQTLIVNKGVDSKVINLILTYSRMTQRKKEYEIYLKKKEKRKKKYLYLIKANKMLDIFIISKDKLENNPTVDENLSSVIPASESEVSNTSTTIPSNFVKIMYNPRVRRLSNNYNNYFLIYLLNDFLDKEKKIGEESKELIFNITKNFWYILVKRRGCSYFITLNESGVTLRMIEEKIIQPLISGDKK